jgi:hypothetical protein
LASVYFLAHALQVFDEILMRWCGACCLILIDRFVPQYCS